MTNLSLLLRHLPHLLAATLPVLAGLAALDQGVAGIPVVVWMRMRRRSRRLWS